MPATRFVHVGQQKLICLGEITHSDQNCAVKYFGKAVTNKGD